MEKRDSLNTDERVLNAIEEIAEGDVADENSEAYQLWADGYYRDLSSEKTQQKIISIINRDHIPDHTDDTLQWGDSHWSIVQDGKWVLQED